MKATHERLGATRAGRAPLALRLALVLALAGCAAAPGPGAVQVPVLPSQFPPAAAAAAGQDAGFAGPRWWTLFGDADINAVVERVLVANGDLRLAAARVDEAAAVLGQARAAQWPSLEAGASVARTRNSAFTGQPVGPVESTSHRIVLSTAFEIDLWGRLRQANEAARLQLLAASHARDAVGVALAASAVQLVVGLRALDAQAQALTQQRRAREESLAIVQRRLAAGTVSGLDEAQSRAALAATDAQRVVLARQRAALEQQLALLLAQPGRVQPVRVDLPQPAMPPAGLPAALLERRPDLQQARAAAESAVAQVAVARASALPAISLTGSLGAQSADLADLLRPGARIGSIGAALLATLFDGGRREAVTSQARARAQQAAIAYEQAAQGAFREVADALNAARFAADQEAVVQRQREAAGDALRLATRRYDAGYAGYLEVLDAQRNVQDAELAAVQVRQLRIDAGVAMAKALGGGWRADDARAAGLLR